MNKKTVIVDTFDISTSKSEKLCLILSNNLLNTRLEKFLAIPLFNFIFTVCDKFFFLISTN